MYLGRQHELIESLLNNGVLGFQLKPCTSDESQPYDRKLDYILNKSKELLSSKEHKLAASGLFKRSIRSVCVNPNIRLDRTNMTHTCRELKIVDQKETGTCWMQAGLTLLSAYSAKKDFSMRFSSTYLAFFDKLEKARTFLRFLKTSPDDRSLWHYLYDGPIQDGGTFEMFVYLVKTYGLIPHDHMPMTYQSTHTSQINKFLNFFLRSVVHEVMDGTLSEEDVMSQVHEAVLRAYSIPPDVISLNKKTHGIDLTIRAHKVPYLIKENWEFVVLTHAPDREHGWYIGPYGNDPDNLWQDIFYCTDLESIVRSCVEQLALGIPIWMSADINHDFSSVFEMAALDLYDTDTVLGLTTRDTYSKMDRMRNRNTAPVHAMLFVGVKLDDVTKTPTSWLIQNSWGKRKSVHTGMIAASHGWFQQHVFQVAIEKRFVPDVPVFAHSQSTKLNPWDIFATVAK